jgi:hypothetical protein
MQPHLIYWPVLVQIAIPLAVLILNGRRKAADVAAGKHRPDESATNNTAWSLPVVLTSNNLANQAQLPVLFYVLCLIMAQVNAVSALTLSIAWLFVISRILHAYVHVSTNYVPLRMRAFLFGALMLILLFILCIIALLQF